MELTLVKDYSIHIALWPKCCNSYCSTFSYSGCDDYFPVDSKRVLGVLCRRPHFHSPKRCIPWEGARCYSFVCQYVTVLKAEEAANVETERVNEL